MKMFAAFALLLAAAPCSATPPEEQAFAAEMAKRLSDKIPAAKFTLKAGEPLVIVTNGAGWEDGLVNLHRIHGYCAQANAQDCEAAKVAFVQKLAIPTSKPAAAKLRVIVRDSEYVNHLRQYEAEGRGKGGRLAFVKPIGDDLFALLALDSPDQISTVGDPALKELGLEAKEAWELASAQTASLLPRVPTPEQLAKSAVVLEGEEYLGGILADLPAWAKLASAVGPNLFVTVVSDQFVFVGNMPDGPDLERFKESVREDCAAQQRCISPNVYRFRNGRWMAARGRGAARPMP
jgi:hypothetical protein